MTVSHDTTPESPADTQPDEQPAKRDRPGLNLLAILVGVPVVLLVMLLCFLIPSLNSGAKDLPLAVSGPEQAVAQVIGALQSQSPDAFAVTTYDSTAAAREAVADREEIGAITVDENGVGIVYASGAGSSYVPLLQQVGSALKAQGQTVTYEDVAPLTEEDPTGSAIAVLGLPLVFGGNVSAILLITLLKSHPRLRLIGGLLMSITGGVATAAVMQYGLGVVVVLLLFLASPLAGLATGPWWLPAPWGTIGQILPIGAAGTAIRSAAFFDGAGSGTAFLVLGCWALAGFLLSAFISRHMSRSAEAATTA